VTDQEIDTVEQEFDQAWEQAVPAQDFPLPPPSGWLPKDFPHLTVDLVPVEQLCAGPTTGRNPPRRRIR
jgi:hypothetical protein